MTDEQIEQVDKAGEAIEDAQEDVGRGMQWYARAYITVLIALMITGVVGAFHFGIISPASLIDSLPDLTWLFRYLAIYLAVLFVFVTTSMTLIALPVGFVSGLMSAVARIADAYELPDK